MRLSFRPCVALALSIAPSLAHTGDHVVARLAGFTPERVRQTQLSVVRPVEVVIEGVGAGEQGGGLYSYGWLVRTHAGSVGWSMQDASPRASGESDLNVTFRDRIRLEPGDYHLYYFAGHAHQAPGPMNLKRLLMPGRQRPAEWYIALRVADADRDAVRLGPIVRDEQSEVRLAPLGDDVYASRRFRLTTRAEVEIIALGEMYKSGKMMADSSWLSELESRARRWSMNAPETAHAGGVKKNREVRRKVTLDAGLYELVAVTDDSHAFDSWNSLPPTSPDDWGITLRAPAGTIDTADIPPERMIVRLTGAQDDESLSARFHLDRETLVRIYAFGEWSGGHDQFVDFGWLEKVGSGRVEQIRAGGELWRMTEAGSVHAGGSSKNRVADTALRLGPGEYRVHYVTDDSHSAEEYNSDPPYDRAGWGIQLSTFDGQASWQLLDLLVRRAE